MTQTYIVECINGTTCQIATVSDGLGKTAVFTTRQDAQAIADYWASLQPSPHIAYIVSPNHAFHN